MSKLERLIQQYCPDGVEYVKLDSVCSVMRGKRLTKSQLTSDGKYKVFHGGIEPIGFYDEWNREGNTTMVINVGASAGTIGYSSEKFWSSDGCFCLSQSNLISGKFLFYYFQTIEGYLMSKVRRAGIPTLDGKILEDLIIPVPPLPVQEEIVRILDTFTELQAELQAELQKRQQQYNFYRDNLLNFNRGGQEIKWMKLKEIGKVCMCKRILKEQTVSSGDVPFYKIGTFGGVADAYIPQELFDSYKSKFSYPQKGDILISAAGTIGRTVEFDGKPAYFQDSNIVWLKHDESIVLNSYLKYCYTQNPWAISTGGTIARLYNDNILNATIPVPPIAEQQRIVAILDRFDTLTNDLTSGLPAEMEKRRQQYEYYRDRLLTFKRL